MTASNQPRPTRLRYCADIYFGYHLATATAALTGAFTNALAWLAWRTWGPLFTRAWRQGVRLNPDRPFPDLPTRYSPARTEMGRPDPHPSRHIWRAHVP